MVMFSVLFLSEVWVEALIMGLLKTQSLIHVGVYLVLSDIPLELKELILPILHNLKMISIPARLYLEWRCSIPT